MSFVSTRARQREVLRPLASSTPQASHSLPLYSWQWDKTRSLTVAQHRQVARNMLEVEAPVIACNLYLAGRRRSTCKRSRSHCTVLSHLATLLMVLFIAGNSYETVLFVCINFTTVQRHGGSFFGLTPSSSVLLEKLTVAWLVKNSSTITEHDAQYRGHEVQSSVKTFQSTRPIFFMKHPS